MKALSGGLITRSDIAYAYLLHIKMHYQYGEFKKKVNLMNLSLIKSKHQF